MPSKNVDLRARWDEIKGSKSPIGSLLMSDEEDEDQGEDIPVAEVRDGNGKNLVETEQI